MASTNVRSAFAWSTVLASLTRSPTGGVSARDSLISSNSFALGVLPSASGSGGGSCFTCLPPDMGSTLSSSSTTRHESHLPNDRINRSLKRATTSLWASVRYREWTSIDNVYSCFKLFMPFNRRMTSPPPSTVSIVRAKRFGVIPSKSCKIHMPYVLPRIFSVSL